MAGNWFAPCPKNSNKSHYPDCLDMPICPWCRTPNPAFPQGPDPTPPQALQPPAPPLQLEQPTTLVQSTEESSLVTPVSSGPPASLFTPTAIKAKESTKKAEPGPVWAVTPFCHYYPSSGDTCQSGSSLLSTAVSKAQASSAGSKPPQLPTAGTADMNNLSQPQNPPVESFDIVWRFYIIDYNVDSVGLNPLKLNLGRDSRFRIQWRVGFKIQIQ